HVMIIIYCLIDPRDYNIRYVGRTNNLIRRLAEHKTKCYTENSIYHTAKWLRKLHKLGLEPIAKILEECSLENCHEREIFWIARGRLLGWKLTNSTDGGDGMLNASLETRLKLSQSVKRA